MELVEKRIFYSELLHIYGDLLSTTQKDVLIDYLDCDLSLTEIAENRGISRAAVEDAIKKGKKKLDQFEAVVKAATKKENILKNIAVLKEKIGNCDEISSIEEELK